MQYIGELLFLGNGNFALELLLFMYVAFTNIKKRSYFYPKLIMAFLLAPLFYFLPTLNVGFFNFVYVIVFLFVSLTAFALYKTNFKTLFTLLSTSWAMQHLAWNTVCLFLDYGFGDLILPTGVPVTIYILIFVAYAIIFKIVFLKNKEFFDEVKINKNVLIGSVVVLLITIFLSAMTGYYDEWTWIYRLYTMFIALFGVLLAVGVFDQTRIEKQKITAEHSNEMLKRLIKEQARQQQLNKETFDIVNVKIHDLKHQIKVIQSLQPEDQTKYLNELKELVDIYGSSAKTGNDVLDVILNEKSLVCNSKNINFTYICDGDALNFLEAEDLTPLFGNLIDNAIEGTQAEKNRFIKLTAMNRKGFLCIHIENYCSSNIEFEHGLPITNKENKTEHGFGTKSISYIVKKYNGQYKFSHRDDIFSVNITIPIEK